MALLPREYICRYRSDGRVIEMETFPSMRSAEKWLADYGIWRDAARGALTAHAGWSIRFSSFTVPSTVRPATVFDVEYDPTA